MIKFNTHKDELNLLSNCYLCSGACYFNSNYYVESEFPFKTYMFIYKFLRQLYFSSSWTYSSLVVIHYWSSSLENIQYESKSYLDSESL